MIVLKIASIILTCFWLGSLLYLYNGFCKWFYHNILGWHMPDNGNYDIHSSRIVHRCKYCEGNLIKDQRGNWILEE